jgi:ferredoxin-type protein NapH
MSFLKRIYKKYGYSILLLFLISGLFNPTIAILALLCMMGPIFLSLFKGRLWCGHICPRGNFFDNIISQFSNDKKVPWILRNILVRALVAVVMLYFFIHNTLMQWGNFKEIGMIFYKMIALTTIVGIFLSLLFHERTWCHMCPMGSISAFFSIFSGQKNSLKVLSSCVNCKRCANVCPLSIRPFKYKGKVISHPDCIKCNKCAEVCPKKAILG